MGNRRMKWKAGGMSDDGKIFLTLFSGILNIFLILFSNKGGVKKNLDAAQPRRGAGGWKRTSMLSI